METMTKEEFFERHPELYKKYEARKWSHANGRNPNNTNSPSRNETNTTETTTECPEVANCGKQLRNFVNREFKLLVLAGLTVLILFSLLSLLKR